MHLGRVQQRGQVTLPRGVRKAAGIEPGDVVTFDVIAPGQITVRSLPRLRLADAFEKYHIEGPVDDAVDRLDWQDVASRDILGE
ncbi:MAG: AbrB/MazE/SpoVT family DNA-binding domain-containing protein [Chloroflexota bacterium]